MKAEKIALVAGIDLSENMEQIRNLVQDAVLLLPLAEHYNLRLVDKSNTEARALADRIRDVSAKNKIGNSSTLAPSV